jgi:hypothetical protein
MNPTKECPCCGEVKPMTKHHIFPVRHFGRKNNTFIFMLCRECHSELERYIPFAQMPRAFYNAIMLVFKEHLCKRVRRRL